MIARVCWALNGGKLCAGPVTWTRCADGWLSRCGRCQASGLAASGERAQLEQLEVKP